MRKDLFLDFCSRRMDHSYGGLWREPHAPWCAPLAPIHIFMFLSFEMCVAAKSGQENHLLCISLMKERGSLCWSHERSSDPLSSCLVKACFHCIMLPCITNADLFTGSTIWRVNYRLGQPIGSIILPITHALYFRRYHGQTMIAILLLFSSCGANHLENLQRHFMAVYFLGQLGPLLEAIPFQPKDRGSPLCTIQGEKILLG